MGEERIRPRNVAMLFKLETTVGTDAAPTLADAFPFEADGYNYNSPYRREQSNEANGSFVAGAPLVIAQPAEVTIRVRVKGAGAGKVYSPTVKPPHHALLQACGLRGLFTASIAAAALTAGTATSATLPAGFTGGDGAYLGMPLQLSGGGSEGRIAHVVDFKSGVATLADTFDTPLDTSVTAALPANWTYAGTSPKDVAARATDRPSGTLYLYEDGTLHKFVGCRGQITELGGNTARPGYATFRFMGVYAGKFDATIPAVTVPQHSAPVLAMGTGGVTPAFVVNRKELAVSQWGLNADQELESPDDPNTAYGFSAAQIGERTPMLTCNPLATTVAVRNTLSQIAAFAQYPGVVRCGSALRNRWGATMPILQPVESAPGTRGQFRSEELSLRILSPADRDPQSRDNELVLCFW